MDYVLKKEKHKRQLNMGTVQVVYNSNDKEVFGIACCYCASLIWFITRLPVGEIAINQNKNYVIQITFGSFSRSASLYINGSSRSSRSILLTWFQLIVFAFQTHNPLTTGSTFYHIQSQDNSMLMVT